MIFYHGSKQTIEYPTPGGSNPSNDYGPSFYLTTELADAKDWACRNESLGIVNKYKVDARSFDSLKVLDLTDKKSRSVLNWIAILMHFRTLDESFRRNNRLILEWLEHYYIDVCEYDVDVIKGFRADDAYFRFPIRFISNDLAYEDLEKAFLLGNLGIQFAFMSERALRLLKYAGSIECESEYIGRYYARISNATQSFNEILEEPRDPKKTYILDLMRQDHE